MLPSSIGACNRLAELLIQNCAIQLLPPELGIVRFFDAVIAADTRKKRQSGIPLRRESSKDGRESFSQLSSMPR
jgi:hypothetical protein